MPAIAALNLPHTAANIVSYLVLAVCQVSEGLRLCQHMLLPAATPSTAAASCSAAAIGPAAAADASQPLSLLVCKQLQVICQHVSYCVL
jgi:hypothetical protein